jgi:DNA polymerase elongation subunit (family B)
MLNKRIPFHDNTKLTQWYGHDNGRERWRVICHRLTQACAVLQLFDALNIIRGTGEVSWLNADCRLFLGRSALTCCEPSVIQKKKYCGMKFKSKDQRKPTFEAKVIETIRCDQCALTQKLLRNILVTIFRSGSEAVQTYLYRQWALILFGRLPVADFILTGRVRSKY